MSTYGYKNYGFPLSASNEQSYEDLVLSPNKKSDVLVLLVGSFFFFMVLP